MNHSLDSVFYPASVAIVGASPGKPGQMFLDSILMFGFKGKVYAVNPSGTEVSGMRAYANMEDLQQSCIASGLPVYHSMDGAARAIDSVLRYYERKATRAKEG
ncbi:MAG: CoA-binding protein [Chloroflexi bacterium]|nr:CoA-binding protein [Chloroflexota bacterium]